MTLAVVPSLVLDGRRSPRTPFSTSFALEHSAHCSQQQQQQQPSKLRQPFSRICKQTRIGGAVVSHRDSTFLPTAPSTATGFWFALKRLHAYETVVLSFVRPGSHKDGGANQKAISCARKSSFSRPLGQTMCQRGNRIGEVSTLASYKAEEFLLSGK